MKRTLLICIVAIVMASPFALAKDRFEVEDVSFQANCDGTTQNYVRMLPKNFDVSKPHDLLIGLHGHGSDRWQFVNLMEGTGLACRNTAIQNDMILIFPDYRARTSWMGPKAEADLLQIIEDLKKQYKINQVFLSGGSMGGSSTLSFTAMHPDLIDGVVSVNGTANHLEYTNFQDAISESFGGTKQQMPEEYKKRSAEYWPERFTMPIGITASGQDTVVPPQSVLRLADVLQKLGRDVQLTYNEDLGHRTPYQDIEKLFDFVIAKAKERQSRDKP